MVESLASGQFFESSRSIICFPPASESGQDSCFILYFAHITMWRCKAQYMPFLIRLNLEELGDTRCVFLCDKQGVARTRSRIARAGWTSPPIRWNTPSAGCASAWTGRLCPVWNEIDAGELIGEPKEYVADFRQRQHRSHAKAQRKATPIHPFILASLRETAVAVTPRPARSRP